MSLQIAFAPWYDADLLLCMAWYAEQGGDRLAERFLEAVEATVNRLAQNPHRGRRPFPNDKDLFELHSVLIERPFQKLVLFFRFTNDTLILERLIHGARDLPRRIRESPKETD